MSGAAGHSHTRRHEHLWRLPDGTGLHAPPGRLSRDADTGQLCCHICGEYFRSLGAHVRVHGYTASTYRSAMGLSRSRPLTSPELSGAISRRQRQTYQSSAATREDLAHGHAMARSGELSQRARAVAADPPPETKAIRSETLAGGRKTKALRRQQDITSRLAALGVNYLDGYLVATYQHGASIDELARQTGLGRATLRRTLTEVGVAIRPAGANTAGGKKSRALVADEAAATRLGVADLDHWLAGQHADGTTLTDLARAVAHSTHWVRWRIARAALTAEVVLMDADVPVEG